MNIEDFLRAEKYDLHSDSGTLDRRLLREVGSERASRLKKIWDLADESARLDGMYGFPETLREAHLLFSHDRRRIIDSMRWVLAQLPFEGPVVDLGCGTGTLVRLLAHELLEVDIVGIDFKANLISSARDVMLRHPNAQLRVGSHDKLDLTALARTLISICGVEWLDQPPASAEDYELFATADASETMLQYVRMRMTPLFRHWRANIMAGGRLLFLSRVSSLPLIAAAVVEAGSAGFKFQPQESPTSRAALSDSPLWCLLRAKHLPSTARLSFLG